MSAAVGNVFEMFSSVQGEGILVGRRQVFLRLAECNRECAFCDTPQARVVTRYARIQIAPESETFQTVPNPLSVRQVEGFVWRLNTPGRPQPAVAVTGGEPLMQPDFVEAVLAALAARGAGALLETNGTLPDALERVIGRVHTVSMDIKIPSAAGFAFDPEATRRFLRVARRRPTYVKIVVAGATTEGELLEALAVVESVDRNVPLVLQPVTPNERVAAPSPAQLLRLERCASQRLSDVRVIPQVHKTISLR